MTLKTTEDVWRDAQGYEKKTWEVNNRRNSALKTVVRFMRLLKTPKELLKAIKYGDFYCGDDWNYWWADKFHDYEDLPKSINNALEVGCGPYTNIRLISRLKDISRITCSDPLMDTYGTFKNTWVSSKKPGVTFRKEGIESIDSPDGSFDLVVCNNVLDHILDVEKGFDEIHRVLADGGYFVFGQDLVDSPREGHPINLSESDADRLLSGKYRTILKRFLPTEQSRDASYSGTYIFIGRKI